MILMSQPLDVSSWYLQVHVNIETVEENPAEAENLNKNRLPARQTREKQDKTYSALLFKRNIRGCITCVSRVFTAAIL